jgi:hypothetical protein
MFFLKKKPSMKQIVDELRPTIGRKDDAHLQELLNALIEIRSQDPAEAESSIGWAILAACEMKMPCTERFLPWFLNEYPNSVMPVAVTYAEYLSGTEDHDNATVHARHYLSVLNRVGGFDRIAGNRNMRIGASSAFLILTDAYTHCGARCYSQKILQHASRMPLESSLLESYRKEMARLDEELKDDQNAKINHVWKSFFENRQYASKLITWCESKKCMTLAKRIELLEAQFRFQSEFRIDEREMFLEVCEAPLPDGKTVFILR